MNHHLIKIILLFGFFSVTTYALFVLVMAIPTTAENISNNSSMLINQKISFQTLPELGNRSAYVSKNNDISMTFGQPGILEQYFYQNFFTSNFSEPEDYFCIPDDFILAYNQNNSFRVKVLALNWTTYHNLSADHDKAVLINSFSEKSGFNPFYNNSSIAYGNSSDWQVPPLTINVVHELKYDENYVPMKIRVNNTFSEPLRIIYVLQDGAWMTNFKMGNQENVHFYWDDGESDSPRRWIIDKENRKNKNNWVGMYCDNNGGMFAGIYSPPESTGIVEHVTWNIFWMIGDFPSVKSMDNILKGVYGEPIRKGHENDNGKFHGTIIDFGTVRPGEEKEQIIVKIMFTGYTNRTDMHIRINEIIERIPEYKLNNTYFNRKNTLEKNVLSLGSINLPFPRNLPAKN